MIERDAQALKYFNNLILGKLSSVPCWIAGGALRDYYSGDTDFSDIDIFFPDQRAFDNAKDILGTPHSENDRVTNYIIKGKKIQLIRSHFFKNPAETIIHFDFTVCSIAMDLKTIYFHKTFFQDLAQRKLVINSLPYPVSTLYRLQKYIKKGYTICSGGIITLAEAIQKADLDSHIDKIAMYPID